MLNSIRIQHKVIKELSMIVCKVNQPITRCYPQPNVNSFRFESAFQQLSA